MLSGVTCSASEMAGTAVFRMVVSSDSIKNATATSHGRSCLLEADGAAGSEWELVDLAGLGDIGWSEYFPNEPEVLLAFLPTTTNSNRADSASQTARSPANSVGRGRVFHLVRKVLD